MGAAMEALLINLSRQGLSYIPALFLMNTVIGLDGLIWAQPVADLIIDWDGGNPLFENHAENTEQNRNNSHCITAVYPATCLPPYELDIPAIFANILPLMD